MEFTEFYQAIIGLVDLEINSVEHSTSQIIMHCSLGKKTDICPNCNEPSAILHQYKQRQVRDLSISGKEVWLHLRLRQFHCPTCQSHFIQKVDWLLPGKSYTKRQAKWMFEVCAKQPFTEAGALLNMCPKTLENNFYRQAKQQLDLTTRYAQVKHLGIDELSHRKGKKDYVCVLVDLERNIEIDILPDRKKETLLAHFQGLGEAFCQQIEVVSCDMWPAYIDVAQTCFPQAEIVLDRFHVVKALNEVLDQTRKDLRRENKEQESFKHIKWQLFKRPEKCSKQEQQSLDVAFEASWELEEIYELRNTFNRLFDIAPSQKKLNQQLHHWLIHAQQIGNKYLNKFIKTLTKWKKHITSFANHRITNAATEGLNNYIRYFKRISFGLPSFKNMRLRILAQMQ